MVTPTNEAGMEEDGRGRPALPADLTREIKAFIRANPDMAENNLSGFTTTACKLYLARLRREKFIKLVSQQIEEGRLPEGFADAFDVPDD